MKTKETEMTMSDFYYFSNRGSLTTFGVSADVFNYLIHNGVRGEAGAFYRDLSLGNYSGKEFPIVFRKDGDGNRFRDFLTTYWLHLDIVSDMASELWPEESTSASGRAGPGTDSLVASLLGMTMGVMIDMLLVANTLIFSLICLAQEKL